MTAAKEGFILNKKRILIVDDEENILELLKYNLEKNGFEVVPEDNGEDALEEMEREDFDLVILDLMLPGIDGLEVLKTIRGHQRIKNIPVIMLTAKNEEIDTVLGLEMGADDYIGKPFGVHELLARVKALLRRNDRTKIEKDVSQEFDIIDIDNIKINKSTQEVTINGENVELTLKEFEVLYLLAKNKGRVFGRDYLLEKIWGYDYLGETRTVDVHIRNLRKKIEEDDKNPKHIKTVRGIGYKYV
ncbi:two-component system, OmpR family, alkaline phosphatase synthesis response regulator PhoP [Dethiosulfatibacter aminovorans DSM 17477]|uniref:Two-component system, OmpR family, alkaline phosphatase synthesis response regulator PhoP n=1 Tax=Dethiosulfatibacter aminovorans DSM 17477 TaxID=1121476 RepID=A0A1M6I3J3_9FIRM|nr:two-component system, OmpR family, alkaline phosphatase synthesis response regulator PhoP [Dethiosulfatibacter aminovorans DSM 17477]